jgi:putative hydrolase of the HAD superfamily
MTKALIFDFDNTLFPTKTITDEVFEGVYALMQDYRGSISDENLEAIKQRLAGTAFQKVADEFGLPDELRRKAIELLNNAAYHKPIPLFKDYGLIKSISLPKFLVTFGFMKLQQSKIDSAGVQKDFKEVIVVDPEISRETKRDVFVRLMDQYGYRPDELIAIGDDPESEIGAARDLGIKTYLFDPESKFKSRGVTWHEPRYKKLLAVIDAGD